MRNGSCAQPKNFATPEPVPIPNSSPAAGAKSPALETRQPSGASPLPEPSGRRGATFRGSAARPRALDRAAPLQWRKMCRLLRPRQFPTACPRDCASPFRSATTTCFGSSPGRRPSVKAMSISGTMVPRRLNTPMRNAGVSGMRVTIGQSTTSSTSRTEKQKRSRPARKTQYWRSGRRSSEKTSLSRNAPPSSSAESAAFSSRFAFRGHQANLFTALSSSSGVNGLET